MNTKLKTSLNPSLARALGGSVGAALLLVACGGGGGGGDTPQPTPSPVVTTAVVSTTRYAQPLLLTLTGTNLDQPMTVTSAGCASPVRSTTAPNISTATTALLHLHRDGRGRATVCHCTQF